ncbi:hypothetical protein MAR_028437, partial [Mya arenaria]
TLSHLAILLLSISCDVELNPGPDFPCGSCGNEVLDSDHAVECDKYKLVQPTICPYRQIIASALLLTKTFPHKIPYPHLHNKNNKSIPKQPRFVSKLKILCINCQSVVNKKLELQNLIYNKNPDIVAGTESWLKRTIIQVSYTALRKDRLKGKGGGVFLLVKNNLVVSEQPKLQTNFEIVWVKLEIKGCKPMYISSYYRPHESDLQSLLELEKSLDIVNKLKGTKLILGDFNFPKLTWDSEHMPHLKPGFSTTTVYDKFLDIINDQNMTQMVSENTRNDNILDLFLTTNLTFVDKVNIIPGISDHDIISTIVNARPNILKQKPRIVPLYRKANWDDFKQFMNTTKSDILQGSDSLSVEEIWLRFTDAIKKGITQFTPVKKIGCKRALPWITKEIKRLIHKRDKLYTNLKKNRTDSNISDKFKSLKATI